jgi:hypothetical protein
VSGQFGGFHLAYGRWFDLVPRSLSNQSEANHKPPAMTRKGPIQKMALSFPRHTPSMHSHTHALSVIGRPQHQKSASKGPLVNSGE